MASFGKNWEAMIKHSPLFSDGSGVKFKTPDMDGFENVKNKKGLTNDYDEKIKDFYGDIDTDSLQILIGSVGDRIGKSVITFNNKKGVEFQIPFRRDSGNEGMIADIFALAQGTDTPAMNSLVISALYPGKSSKEVAGKLLENRLSKKEQEKIVFTGRSGRGYTVEVPLGSSKSADLLNRVINANGNNSFVARFENGRLVINSDEPGKIFAALQMLNK
jgi:hypothetical protein